MEHHEGEDPDRAEDGADSSAYGRRGRARASRGFTTDPVTRWLRRLSLLAALAIGIAVLLRYPSLPETIPTHFNALGEADGWGSRNAVFGLVAVFVPICAGVAWLSAYPGVLQYPFPVTEENAPRVYREGERTIVWLGIAIALLFGGIAGIAVFQLQTAALIGIGIAGCVAAPIIGAVRMSRSL